MIKDILDGTKEVLVELTTGMVETCKELSLQSTTLCDDIEVKLMGTYQEIEAYEKAKLEQSVKEAA
ncbi:MAG: Unknown protein [uncultured Sulfurovum sp.]|uniref:Uncharacterized protein n=1 Tax=uncultured Sulfurovum sp. TaxID=269237 RepID=A0A6S6T7R8_9BACT|nr:MAG: Unknown protein [uncultured Sulfurovum sp.]